MSIRLRLTLLYSGILALTLIGFSGALYLTLAETTQRLVRDALVAEAQRISEDKNFSLQKFVAPNGPALPETYVQTRDTTGAIVAQSFGYSDFDLPLDDAARASVVAGEPAFAFMPKANQRLLVYSVPVVAAGQTIGVLQVARSFADQDEALAALQRLLMIGCALVPLVAFGICWLLAGAALRPIDRITATAQLIGDQRAFDQRVQHRGPQDEVGRLATVFNTMLGALQEAYAQQEQALQQQRRFVADASHELRTPLTSIRGNLDLLGRQPPISAADFAATLRDTTDETDRMIRLVNQLFVLARVDAGTTQRREPVALRPLLEAVTRQAQILAPEHTIVNTAIHDITVCADPDSLRQVLVVLVDNAWRHTPARTRITLHAEPHGDHVAISVADTGPGIPALLLPQIFDRFVRGDAARTGEGAGLGLAIARALVEGQDGTLTATSTPGVGSTFVVTMPAHPASHG